MKIRLGTIIVATALALDAVARPAPRPALAARLAEGPEIIGIVLSSTTESGETDTARWMTAEQ